jgi:LAO/AO transport system kinase
MGDEVQAMKAGILEIADVLVVNKADLPLAQRTTKQLTNMLELRHHNRDVPVLETVALTETGIDALHDAIVSRLAASAGDKRRRREQRMRRLIADCAGRIVRGLIRDAGDELADLVQAAASGEIGVDAAARRALRTVRSQLSRRCWLRRRYFAQSLRPKRRKRSQILSSCLWTTWATAN